MLLLLFLYIFESNKGLLKYLKGDVRVMKQIKNNFADYYYLEEDGRVYNINTKKYLKYDKYHRYKLITQERKNKGNIIKKIILIDI